MADASRPLNDCAPVRDALHRAAVRDLEKGGDWWRSTREVADAAGLKIGRARVLLERLYEADEIEVDNYERTSLWRLPKAKPVLRFLDFDARRDPKTACFCIKCQRDLTPDQPRRVVHLLNGPWVVHPAGPQPEDGEVQVHLIGEDCAYLLGIFWTRDPAPVQPGAA